MSEEMQTAPIRLSLNQIRSNPVLASMREYNRGRGRRDQERRQLARLKQLQDEGVVLHRIPKMIRVDSAAMSISRDDIGVVGLVVDNQGQGYVTKLKVTPNPTWDISVDLPFRPVHIQNLLLRVLSGPGLEDSLPELFAYRITDSLAARCEGDSMDVACLLAILDSSVNPKSPLLHAAAAVVSPTMDGLLEPSKSVSSKLNAFVREFGMGSLLVRHVTDDVAGEFDNYFDQVWTVTDLSDLASRLNDVGLTRTLLEKVTLRSEHQFAIASQMDTLLRNESEFGKAEDFLNRLKRRISAETPLKIRLDVSLAEEDLHRHRGNFDAAIDTRNQRMQIAVSPLVSCYEREADSDNRHAAALYDAHRFTVAIDFLRPWAERFSMDAKICLPETRAKLLNTLARCMVVVGEANWESLFLHSLEVQSFSDPGNVEVTENFLAHAYLKVNRFKDAERVLRFDGDTRDPFRVWLAAECSRQAGETWNESQCEFVNSIPKVSHVHGFACQAIARQLGRTKDSQIHFFERARRSFGYGMASDVSNVKRVLEASCIISIALLRDDAKGFIEAINIFRRDLNSKSFKDICDWYQVEIDRIVTEQNWHAVETLFKRIPHL